MYAHTYIHTLTICFNRFEHFWRSCNDQRTLDPELSKVLMFLCPPNELHFVLQEVPPIVATSYFTHMNSCGDKKKLEAKQVYDNACYVFSLKVVSI